MQTEILISFIGYMLVMLAIGFYFYFKTSDLSDYVLGGRGLNPSVTALSAGASDMSGWLLLGLPGMMYSDGLVGSWIAVGLLIGAYINWKYVAKRLRVYTHHLNDSITIPDYFANRFEDKGNTLRVVTAVVILVFYTLYTSSGLVGGAKLFEATFNIAYSDALLIGSFVIVSYTFLGGYNAVSWTDFIQGILMMLALVITPIVVITELGGVSSALSTIESIDPTHLDMVAGASVISVISLLTWGLGYFGQPHILVRFMSIRDEDEMCVAKNIGMGWMGISIIGSLSVGFFGLAYVTANGVDLADSEKIFITLSQLVFNPWIAGFLLAAILAAIMSTVDSQLLVSSSVLTRDIYHSIIHKDASDKELVWVGRATVIGIAVIAWYLSTDANSSVLSLVAYAWAGFGAAFGPIIILSLYNRNINRIGAISGMVVGALTVIIYKQLEGGIFDIFELLPGFIFSWITILIVSKYTQVNSSSILKNFDEVQKRLNK
ncbi:sodium/proline symporter PutP [Sulfurimonas sp.]|uniref:sodium/proline symporter PutP n=1 Tax=Sulfurimonas sp. TaxID=2022749 RepID=UPI00356AF524